MHTSCQSSSSSLTLTLEPNQTSITTILSLHNNARSSVSPTAISMAQLTWDSRLARVAQSRANQCIFAHDCNNCRKLLNLGQTVSIGQNAFSQTRGTFSWTDAMNLFLSEKNYFAYGSSNSQGFS